MALMLLWATTELRTRFQGESALKSTKIQAQVLNLPDKIDFNIHVKPIISDRCFKCHGPDKSKVEAGLQLTNFEGATAILKSGMTRTSTVSCESVPMIVLSAPSCSMGSATMT